MVRSFTDRVFGGVLGGIAQSTGVNPWLLRGVFVVLAVLSMGTFAACYVALWWALPQQTLTAAQGSAVLRTLVMIFLIVIFAVLWAGQFSAWWVTPTGDSIFLPLILLCLGVVFVLRHMRG